MIAALHPPAALSSTTSRVVLRDGTTAGVRLTSPADRGAMRRFFDGLSAESLRLRFMASVHVADSFIEQLCDNSSPEKSVTLGVCRIENGATRFIGIGSYFATSPGCAEVAFAVDDRLHGKGIGTALLERLERIATEHGIRCFDATTLSENHDMLDVFRDSGLEMKLTSSAGAVDVRLSLTPTPRSIRAEEERDRVATVASLRPLLSPRSIAVVGVSRDADHVGRRVFDALKTGGFSGDLYAINHATPEIGGRLCYPSVRDLPQEVDLAVIAVPRDAVLDVVDDCAARGVKGVVVISAGFAEQDADGRALQTALVEKVRGYGMRMIGPNCIGVMNAPLGMNASFAERLPAAGRIGLASQSGGLGLAILSMAAARGIGFSTFVSLGNKGDVSGNDMVLYGESDEATRLILLYLESFGNPRRFAQIARRVSRTKPIVAVKAGRSEAGSRAASSHTAGLAASEAAVDGLFKQAGVIRADTIDEMFDIAACLDAQPLPNGRRVAIVTNAGGPGIMAADACSSAGLLVEPAVAGLANPLDLIATADSASYAAAINRLMHAGSIGTLLIIYTVIDSRRAQEHLRAICDAVAAARSEGATGKTVLACVMASSSTEPLIAGVETIPVYSSPERAARALGKAADYVDWKLHALPGFRAFPEMQVAEARTFCQGIVKARGASWLTAAEIQHLFQLLHVRPAAGVAAQSADDAVTLARVFGYPVVAKIASIRAVHKTELDGIRLNLTDDAAVRAAFTELFTRGRQVLGADLEGVLIQPMVKGGVETLIGLTQDRVFGPLIAFGLGGVNVDLFRDVVFGLAPLNDNEADRLMRSVRGFPMLTGYRGRPLADLAALRDLLLRVAYIGDRVPELLELEFNPVIAQPPGRGCEIVDVKAKVGRLSFPES